MLIKELSKMEITLKDAVENLQPNKLAEYVHSICLLFNTFYEKYPVLHEQNEAKKEQRLILVSAFANALKALMSILGIEAHNRI
jgi:arginyl-tRNA synthetase